MDTNEKELLIPKNKHISWFNKQLNKRPQYIELGFFLYFVGYMATAPLLEQWAQAEVEKGHQLKNAYLITELPSSITKRYDLQELLFTTMCDPVGNSSAYESELEDAVQSESSTVLLYLDLALTIPAMLSTLTICSYGDISGRKLGMVLPSVGGALRTCIFLLNIHSGDLLFWYLVAAFIDGISGSALTMFGSSCAYIADTSSVEKRALRFVGLQSLYIFSIAVAQLGIGYVIDLFGFTTAFWVVAFIHIINTFYIIFLIPDSKASKFVAVKEKKQNPSCTERVKQAVCYVRDGIKLVVKEALGSFTVLVEKSPVRYGRLKLSLLLSAFVFNALVLMGTSAVKTLFMLASPFCWDSIMIGYYNAITSVFQGVVGLLVVWAFTKVLKESTVAIIGSISSTLGQALFAVAENGLILYTAIIVLFGYNVVSPLIQAIMSKMVHPNRQGALFATMFSIETACDCISGALMNIFYSATVHIYDGTVFLICTGFYAISTVFLIIYYFVERKPDHHTTSREHLPVIEHIVEPGESSIKENVADQNVLSSEYDNEGNC